MIIMLFETGCALVGVSVVGCFVTSETRTIRRKIRRVLQANEVKASARSVRRQGTAYKAQIGLSYELTAREFQRYLPLLEQALSAKIRFQELPGSLCSLLIGFAPFKEQMRYDPSLTDGLAVPLYSPFGIKWLRFDDETSCHMLLGGATRMGKSVFLRLLAAHLIHATDGAIRVLFVDHKVSDVWAFRNLPQVTVAETSGEVRVFLQDILQLAHDRKDKLKQAGDVVDVKEYRKKYPGDPMEPIFVIFDEYGRFADDDHIQAMVIELAETAGYLDIHLVISAQRPDAKDVLKPRIKANIVTRMSFATYDETNSKITLDIPDAAHIGKIQGRAILVDGFPDLVQVPYISTDEVIKLTERWRKNYEQPRPDGIEIPEALPRFVSGPVGNPDLS